MSEFGCIRDAEMTGSRGAAVDERAMDEVGVLFEMMAEQSRRGSRLAAEAQPVAQAGGVETDEELSSVTAGAARREGDPQCRVVQLATAVSVAAQVRQRPSAARLGVEI